MTLVILVLDLLVVMRCLAVVWENPATAGALHVLVALLVLFVVIVDLVALLVLFAVIVDLAVLLALIEEVVVLVVVHFLDLVVVALVLALSVVVVAVLVLVLLLRTCRHERIPWQRDVSAALEQHMIEERAVAL